MPVFDYQCRVCNSTFDLYHKGREIVEDIECPHCSSREYRKLMSVPAAAVSGKNHTPSDASGGCCRGGMCGVN